MSLYHALRHCTAAVVFHCSVDLCSGYSRHCSCCSGRVDVGLTVQPGIHSTVQHTTRVASVCWLCAGNSSVIDLCDIDNDQVGCQQLCVLVDGGRRQCKCALGFRLADDQHSCISGSRLHIDLARPRRSARHNCHSCHSHRRIHIHTRACFLLNTTCMPCLFNC